MTTAAEPFSVGCCDLQWISDGKAGSELHLQADQVRPVEVAHLGCAKYFVYKCFLDAVCMPKLSLISHRCCLQHLAGRLWYPSPVETQSRWFTGYKKCSWLPSYNYAYGNIAACFRNVHTVTMTCNPLSHALAVLLIALITATKHSSLVSP